MASDEQMKGAPASRSGLASSLFPIWCAYLAFRLEETTHQTRPRNRERKLIPMNFGSAAQAPTMCRVLAGCYRGHRSGGESPCPRDSSKKPDSITRVHTCPQHRAEDELDGRGAEMKRAHPAGRRREDGAPMKTSRSG